MRYYSFIIKANDEIIKKNSKIRLKDYDYDSSICAMNTYIFRNIRNGLSFFAFREEGDSLYADFSFDENSDSLSSAYYTILEIMD